MKSYKFYIRTGGLMEDPTFKWVYDGVEKGNSPEDACNNLYLHSQYYNKEKKTLWAFQIGYENSNGEVIRL